MLLIKLGGSVISNKSNYREFRYSTVERIAKYLPKKEVILVHGGGSFGHVLAKKYRITEGYDAWKVEGFARIGRDMMDLNLRILEILLENDIPVISFPPHAYHIMGEEINMQVFEECLAHELVPLTYGDIIFHRGKGFDICSGDYLMLQLAQKFRPEKTIFLTDVDGIYDRPPSLNGAKLLPIVDENTVLRTSLNVPDVTGGMHYKIEMMRKIAEYSEVYVLNGFHPERIKEVVEGKKFVGTVVK